MKVLVLCGVFAKENEAEVIKKAKGGVEFSANIFQQKLIKGFNEALPGDVFVLSAPFTGSFPNESRIFCFGGFEKAAPGIEYVNFNNVWGLRNISRAAALKKAVKKFALQKSDEEKIIVIYSAHTPFIEAAAFAKSLDAKIKLCLVVPDLPEYMNLSSNRSKLYDFCKKFDIKKMHKAMESVDSFILLTKQMKERLPVGEKPFAVIEGIIWEELEKFRSKQAITPIKNILYAGKLEEKFGIPDLIKAFLEIKDPNYRLILCGRGDCDSFVEEEAKKDGRIIVTGQISPEKVQEYIKNATVLINPRGDNEEYTKYSFPSKTVEYLSSQKAVAAYMLSGMPEEYKDFVFEIEKTKPPKEAIKAAVIAAATAPEEEIEKRYSQFAAYANKKLLAKAAAEKIIEITK